MIQSRIAKGLAKVSLGTLIVQTGGGLGQFAYALWLTPQEFGIWATASASMVLLSALVNVGEVNGYLAGPSLGIRDILPRTLRANLTLGLLALLVAGYFQAFASTEVALLVVILAFEMPLQGRASLFAAALMKTRLQFSLVRAQGISTIARLSIGFAAAWAWHSAVALGLALFTYSAVMVLTTSCEARHYAKRTLFVGGSGPEPKRLRMGRALHQFTQAFPNQVDYLVVAAIASQSFLGLYYFAFQLTTFITGFFAGPLAKTVMAEISRVTPDQRSRVTGQVLLTTASLSTLGVVFVGVLASHAEELVPAHWVGVIVPFLILLAGVPGRFLAPLGEALNMVNGKWRRSTSVNIVDALGTAAASLFALTGDIVILSIAVACWKVAFGCVRAVVALEGHRWRGVWAIVLPTVAIFAVLAISIGTSGSVPVAVWVLSAAVCLGQLVFGQRVFSTRLGLLGGATGRGDLVNRN